MDRLRFGIFLAPFHPAGENPTLALQRDLELVEHLDRLGYDEAWIGEHHSAGSEIIASPEIFIAAAAERTRHIKLGTGVTSIAYHNPLWVAERMVMLDHLTRGRTMLGCGPGSLPTDSMMLGLNPTDTRELLEVDLDIIMRLLAGETVTEHESYEKRSMKVETIPPPRVDEQRTYEETTRTETQRRPADVEVEKRTTIEPGKVVKEKKTETVTEEDD